jgi:hypothetical protein
MNSRKPRCLEFTEQQHIREERVTQKGESHPEKKLQRSSEGFF